MSSSAGKTLLRNIIRHTDAHNRMVEEADMWRLKNQEPSSMSNQHDDRESSRSVYTTDRGGNSRASNDRTAHMDELDQRSTYWMREYDKVESGHTDRWGHDGHKELYPEDFKSDRSDCEEDKRRRKRRKKSKEKKSKKRKKKKSDKADDHDDSANSDAERDNKSRHHKKSRKNERRKSEPRLTENKKIRSKDKKDCDTRHSRKRHKAFGDEERNSDFKRKHSNRKRYDRSVLESRKKQCSSSSSESA